MKERRKAILVSIIGVIALLLMIVGATYAWFNVNIDGDGVVTNVTTATVGPLYYEGVEVTANRVLPGWTSNDTDFKIYGTVTGKEVKYYCTIENIGEVQDVEYRISADGEENTNNATWKNLTEGDIVTGSISSMNNEDIFKIAVRFKETGSDQNSQQGKSLSIKTQCEIEDDNTTRVKININNEKYAKLIGKKDFRVEKGSDQTLSFEVTDGYSFDFLEGCEGTYNNEDNTLLIQNIENDATCTVNFMEGYYVTLINNELEEKIKTTNGTATFNITNTDEFTNIYSDNNATLSYENYTLSINNITKPTTAILSNSLLNTNNNLKDNSYILMINDENITSSIQFDKNITLDINGQSLEFTQLSKRFIINSNVNAKGPGYIKSASVAYSVNENKQLNINNLNIISTNTSSSSAICTNGTTIIENSYIEGPHGIGCHESNNSYTKVSNSEILSTIYHGISANTGYSSTIQLYSSNITGKQYGITQNGTGIVTVCGGTIKGEINDFRVYNGIINYSSNVLFSDNTNTPTITNSGNGIINANQDELCK